MAMKMNIDKEEVKNKPSFASCSLVLPMGWTIVNAVVLWTKKQLLLSLKNNFVGPSIVCQ